MLFINKLFNSIACLLSFTNLQLVIPGRTWILLYLGRTVYKRLWACLALYQSYATGECSLLMCLLAIDTAIKYIYYNIILFLYFGKIDLWYFQGSPYHLVLEFLLKLAVCYSHG